MIKRPPPPPNHLNHGKWGGGGLFVFRVPLENLALIWRRHSYGDVTLVIELLQIWVLWPTPTAFEQGGIFIVPHLLWHGASVFADRPKIIRKATSKGFWGHNIPRIPRGVCECSCCRNDYKHWPEKYPSFLEKHKYYRTVAPS